MFGLEERLGDKIRMLESQVKKLEAALSQAGITAEDQVIGDFGTEAKMKSRSESGAGIKPGSEASGKAAARDLEREHLHEWSHSDPKEGLWICLICKRSAYADAQGPTADLDADPALGELGPELAVAANAIAEASNNRDPGSTRLIAIILQRALPYLAPAIRKRERERIIKKIEGKIRSISGEAAAGLAGRVSDQDSRAEPRPALESEPGAAEALAAITRHVETIARRDKKIANLRNEISQLSTQIENKDRSPRELRKENERLRSGLEQSKFKGGVAEARAQSLEKERDQLLARAGELLRDRADNLLAGD